MHICCVDSKVNPKLDGKPGSEQISRWRQRGILDDEAQLGHMVSSIWGVYAEAFVGNSVLDTNAYDYGAGNGIRFMY